MNDFTKSSALASRTSSISSRMASTSSSRAPLRSETPVSGATSTSSDSEDFRGASVPVPWSEPIRARLGSGAGQRGDEVAGVVTAIQQSCDVLLGAAQRLKGGDALERFAPCQVEDHRIPRGRGNLVGELGQASTTEVGPGIRRRFRDGRLDGGVVDESLHPSRGHQPVIEPLLRSNVGVLEVHQGQLRVRPVQTVPIAVLRQQSQLGDPVELSGAGPEIVAEP